jgi:hypothetical protein
MWTLFYTYFIIQNMNKVFFIVLFQLFVSISAKAFDPNYNPYTDKELKQIKATALAPNPKTDVNCIIKITEEGDSKIIIFCKNKSVYEELFNYWFSYMKPIIADIDGNGLDDVVKFYHHGTLGLQLGCDLLIFSQYEKSHFVKLKLPLDRFTKEDICDINNDKKKEIINCVLVNYEGHNYWVYRCWRLEGKILKNIDESTKFPRAIWFTNKPNNTLISPDKLKEIMKNYPAIDNINNKDNEPNQSQ